MTKFELHNSTRKKSHVANFIYREGRKNPTYMVFSGYSNDLELSSEIARGLVDPSDLEEPYYLVRP